MKLKGKKSLIRIAALCAAFIMTFILGKITAVAAPGYFDMSRTGSLTVTHLSADDEPVAGVTSHLYLVATVDENGQYTITDSFKDCFADQNFFNNNYDYDAWKSCVMYDPGSDSDDLLSYIRSKGIIEAANGVSDSSGRTYYSGLTLGAYYVLSDKAVNDEYSHYFANFIYPVPILENEADGTVITNYSPKASPKKAKVQNDVEVHCHLLKRWNDSGYENNRPSYVEFNIYCDGEFKETVSLSNANNWYYEWSMTGLHEFFVEEISAGEGYTGTITVYQNGHESEFVCTNTYNPPDTPDTPDTPGTPDEPGTPGVPDLPEVLGAIRDLPAVLGARRLPQTGLLWWPVPILLILGMIFIIKGIRKNAKND